MLFCNVFCTTQWASSPLLVTTEWSQTHFHQSGLASSCCKSDLSSLPPLAFEDSLPPVWSCLFLFCKSDLSSLPPLAFVVSSLAPWLFNHS